MAASIGMDSRHLLPPSTREHPPGWWAMVCLIITEGALFAYFLLGVELTAEDVEEPFGSDGDDLTLAAYCETIRKSAEQVFA